MGHNLTRKDREAYEKANAREHHLRDALRRAATHSDETWLEFLRAQMGETTPPRPAPAPAPADAPPDEWWRAVATEVERRGRKRERTSDVLGGCPVPVVGVECYECGFAQRNMVSDLIARYGRDFRMMYLPRALVNCTRKARSCGAMLVYY